MNKVDDLNFVVEELEGYASMVKSQYCVSEGERKLVDKDRDRAINLVKKWFEESLNN